MKFCSAPTDSLSLSSVHEIITTHRLTNSTGLVVMVKWKDYYDPTEEYISRNPSIRRTIAFINYYNDHPELQRFLWQTSIHTRLRLSTSLVGICQVQVGKSIQIQCTCSILHSKMLRFYELMWFALALYILYLFQNGLSLNMCHSGLL